jgi:hypothetical protein
MLNQWRSSCLVLVLCGASALAQKPLDVPPVAAPPPSPSPASITFEVVVTDKAGNPIRGLTQQDFSLFDNKQPATIRSFEAHEIETPHNDPQALFLLIDNVNGNFNIVSVFRWAL